MNNYVDNLHWSTNSENQIHAYKLKLKRSGSERSDSKLTNEQVAYCRQVYKPRDKKFGESALAREFGVSQSTMHAIVKGLSYKSNY